jgi:septum formation protein
VLVLASSSPSRRRILEQAGVPVEIMPANVDEDALTESLQAQGTSPRGIADALAEAKAVKVSLRLPGVLVLGCDQVLAYGTNQLLSKPISLAQAEQHLRTLRGRDHKLIGAAVIALDGRPIWRIVDTATLWMRDFSDAFLTDYLEREGDVLMTTVGAYRLEGAGVHLFSRVQGDFFTILGLPLLPLLDYLRQRKAVLA